MTVQPTAPEEMVTAMRADVCNRILPNSFMLYGDMQAHDRCVIDSHCLSPVYWNSLRRTTADKDDYYKQLIPYMVVSRDDPISQHENGMQVFVYERGVKGGEDRLHAKLSCGIGGHLNPEDINKRLLPCYLGGMLRELHEEVYFNMDHTINFNDFLFPIAFLNDNSNPVGKVHVGLVHHLKLCVDGECEQRHDHLTNGQWFNVAQISENLERFETWSQLTLTGLKIIP